MKQRLKAWWVDKNVISDLQGACKKCQSDPYRFLVGDHSFTNGSNDICSVAFFDIDKAFDTVWIDGLFKHLYDPHEMFIPEARSTVKSVTLANVVT